MKTFIKYIILTVNIIAIILLLVSYLSAWISPSVNVIPAYLSLAYPVLLIVNVLFVLFWLLMFRKVFAYSLIAIFIGWNIMNSFFGFIPQGDKDVTKDNILSVMSYNVKLFSLQSWSEKKPQVDKISALIRKEKPGVIALQEFSGDKHGKNSPYSFKRKIKYYKHHHIHYLLTNSRYYGIATFSQYPIIYKGVLEFNNTLNTCIYSDIVVGADTLRVYNMHLQSVRFNHKENTFLSNIKEVTDEERVEGAKQIVKRLRTAFLKRSVQAEIVKSHIENSPYKVIVCGDFNATPSSYTYQHIKRGLFDSFIEAGKGGIGASYAKGYSWLRIDYVLTDMAMQPVKHRVLSFFESSDHYPVIVNCSL
ncbi:MAG: endonuclease/exonuclease/phosphatase family protein [Bacteroidales bacterium]|nr:endonuclease/exonuclease/phosphatase family protein [Bacteroidales bacterium]